MVIHPIHDGITDLVFQVAEELVQAGELRKSDTDVLDAGQAGLQGGGDVILRCDHAWLAVRAPLPGGSAAGFGSGPRPARWRHLPPVMPG
ncbi:Uncharacterised protein [Escherichia coli]|nr:Uncharacterised protein [Escherichia coli]